MWDGALGLDARQLGITGGDWSGIDKRPDRLARPFICGRRDVPRDRPDSDLGVRYCADCIQILCTAAIGTQCHRTKPLAR
jgi:hypothetical protein